MGNGVRLLSSLVCAGALSLLARPARANQPATAGNLQLGVGFRYGFEQESWGLDPWGAGIGGELGYTAKVPIYVGANFDYFFGESVEREEGSDEARLLQLTVENGYDFALGPALVIRPKAGVGFASIHSESCAVVGGCSEESSIRFALAPGAKLMLSTGSVALSADVRYDLIFLDHMVASALLIGAGVGF